MEVWDKRRRLMYEYVDSRELDRYRRDCSNTMTQLRDELNRQYDIVTQFTLVGSGSHARKLVTRNGNGPFDLDYNLIIVRMPNEYWDNLGSLKETVRRTLHQIEKNEWFSDGKDSTSVITALLHFKDTPQIEFSFDIAILAKNESDNFCRLIHNKRYNQYTWNEVPSSHNVRNKADELKSDGYWGDVRKLYLDKKNMYLRRGDFNHPSFVVYVETINELYSRIYR